jgi:hypothetical protein
MVVLVAVGIGVACEVEPVPTPTLAVMGRREEPVDQPLPGARGVIGEELRRLLRSRRESDQVEIRATEQRELVGSGCGFQTMKLSGLF